MGIWQRAIAPKLTWPSLYSSTRVRAVSGVLTPEVSDVEPFCGSLIHAVHTGGVMFVFAGCQGTWLLCPSPSAEEGGTVPAFSACKSNSARKSSTVLPVRRALLCLSRAASANWSD
eukprot:TRINITY_DN38563_c0_g1_i1.p2 TRINITY_DN38563_c0_g1~~TRINITY_DN38563_c0_g1_i1.p2  ORF type:complete len:116 (-),score=3.04 TRINITY_DN38563_c0_g1_i1:106-453(-)